MLEPKYASNGSMVRCLGNIPDLHNTNEISKENSVIEEYKFNREKLLRILLTHKYLLRPFYTSAILGCNHGWYHCTFFFLPT
jgi:hypothetical protein